MSTVSDHTKTSVSSSRSAANLSDGKGGISLPAVDPLQKKETGHSDEDHSVGKNIDSVSGDPPNSPPTPTQFKALETNTSHSKNAAQFKPVPSRPNLTGMSDQLKAGIESQSGYSMDDVKVHYNSDKPAQFKAHAYAQGSEIHIAPGQERHLPHEAWHVVQQKQGRVEATRQLKGNMSLNDDDGLEQEADIMGAKSLQSSNQGLVKTQEPTTSTAGNSTAVKQLMNAARMVSRPGVLQLTRLTTVTKDEYDDELSIRLDLGKKIGKPSASGVVHMGRLKKETYEEYQADDKGDIPVDRDVAVKIVTNKIEMNDAGTAPREVHVRDEIEKENQKPEAGQAAAVKPTITPDTYEAITVTDPDDEDKVIKYAIIMRYEKDGAMSNHQIERLGQYTPEFDKRMKKYANDLRAALTVVKKAGYHPGDMKADNTLITNVDGDEAKRAILADFGSYKKEHYDTMLDDITFIMNGIMELRGHIVKKDRAGVIAWMDTPDQPWKPPVVRAGAGAAAAAAPADLGQVAPPAAAVAEGGQQQAAVAE